MESLGIKSLLLGGLGVVILGGGIYVVTTVVDPVSENVDGLAESVSDQNKEIPQNFESLNNNGSILDCEFISGKAFVSVGMFDTGNVPLGTSSSSGNWKVSFIAPNKFSWIHTDVVESGTYTCVNGKISASAFRIKYSGTIDSVTGTLLWQGTEYVAE